MGACYASNTLTVVLMDPCSVTALDVQKRARPGPVTAHRFHYQRGFQNPIIIAASCHLKPASVLLRTKRDPVMNPSLQPLFFFFFSFFPFRTDNLLTLRAPLLFDNGAPMT